MLLSNNADKPHPNPQTEETHPVDRRRRQGKAETRDVAKGSPESGLKEGQRDGARDLTEHSVDLENPQLARFEYWDLEKVAIG